ncbi:MAG TPA: hypothetical protein VLE96_00260 [Chlamydiales bacterium]|nr:hypothetical protein [Chlamydiales bacterium]
MLSEIIDNYKGYLPGEIPAALLKSAVGTVVACGLRSDTTTITAKKIGHSLVNSIIHNCVSSPIARYFFRINQNYSKTCLLLALQSWGMVSG